MEGPGTAVVAGIEGHEQFAQFLAAAFAHDEAIRPHAQGFAQQSGQIDAAGALDVGLARLEHHVMGVRGTQFGDLLDRDDPLPHRHVRQQGGQQCRLARTGRSGDQDVLPVVDEGLQLLALTGREHPAPLQRLQIGSGPPGHAYRQGGSAGGDRGEHGVRTDTAVEAHVDAGRRVVEVAPAERDQTDGEPTHLALGRAPRGDAFDPLAAVDEQSALAVDEDVGDGRIGEERRQERQRRVVVPRGRGTDTGQEPERSRRRHAGNLRTTRSAPRRPWPDPWTGPGRRRLGRNGRGTSAISCRRGRSAGRIDPIGPEKEGGGIPSVGGEGCRHASGENWGAPPDASAGSDVRAVDSVRGRQGAAKRHDLFIAIYHLFPGSRDANYRRWPLSEAVTNVTAMKTSRTVARVS